MIGSKSGLNDPVRGVVPSAPGYEITMELQKFTQVLTIRPGGLTLKVVSKKPDLKPVLVLGAPLDGYYSIEFWRGLHQASRDYGIQMVYLGGGLQQNYLQAIPAQGAPNENRSSLLYQLFDPQAFQAVLLWGAQFLHDAPPEYLIELVTHLSSLPIFSLGWGHPGVTALNPDNRTPIYRLVSHLITRHGHSRIAYLAGDSPETPWEVRERQSGYHQALEEAGISPDPRLLVTGRDIQEDYHRLHANLEETENWAESAMRLLVEGRGLIPGKDFTALAARDDRAALRAMEYLTSQGISVPGTVAVVGFDDVEQGRCSIPSLTTASQNFFQYGRNLMAHCIRHLQGDSHASTSGNPPASPSALLPESRVILRESCGCVNRRIQVLSGASPSAPDISRTWPAEALAILDELLTSDPKTPEDQPKGMPKAEISGPPPGETTPTSPETSEHWTTRAKAIRRLADCLSRTGIDPGEIPEALLTRSSSMTTAADTRLSALANDIIQRQMRARTLDQDARQNRIDAASRVLFSRYDMDYILQGLEVQIPMLGGQGAALVLFTSSEKPQDGARLVFWMWHGRRRTIDPEQGIHFDVRTLLPRGYWPGSTAEGEQTRQTGKRVAPRRSGLVDPGQPRQSVPGDQSEGPDAHPRGCSLNVELVQFAGKRIGYLVIQPGKDDTAVTAGLARHLSTGLQGATLVSALRRANEEIQALSRTDALTGLLNRRSLEQRLAEECQRADRYQKEHEPPCLLFLDLDNFKTYNDRYGHWAGDLVLQHFAGILTSQCRQSDQIARFGGDEFVILLIEITLKDAIQSARRIIDAFSRQESLMEVIRLNTPDHAKPPATPPEAPGLSCSIGIARYRHQTPWQTLIQQGDQALYQAKAAGKNRWAVFGS